MANDPPFSGPGNDLNNPINPADYVNDIEDNFTKIKDEVIGVNTRLLAATGPSAQTFVDVLDEGLLVANSPFTKLNFIGPSVTAADFDGDRVDITVAALPIELWFPAVFLGNNSFADFQIGGATNVVRFFSFFIPTDFVSLVSCELIYIKRDSDSIQWQLDSDFGAPGEQFNNHSESQLTGALAETDGDIVALDITGVLTAIAAGDFVGLQADPTQRARPLGIRLIYSQV